MNLERRDMTTEDFLMLMERNAEHYPEWVALTHDQKVYLARLNAETGTAQSYFIDGDLVACGGIRMAGLGEAWLVAKPDLLTGHKKTLFKETKREIQSAQQQGVWCLFASNKISANFLEHLGFRKKEMYLLTERP